MWWIVLLCLVYPLAILMHTRVDITILPSNSWNLQIRPLNVLKAWKSFESQIRTSVKSLGINYFPSYTTGWTFKFVILRTKTSKMANILQLILILGGQNEKPTRGDGCFDVGNELKLFDGTNISRLG